MASVATALWQIFSDFGIPKVLQSENGTESVNQMVAKLVAERAVATVSTALKKMIKDEDKWPQHLPFVQLSINTRISTVTGSTPFSLRFNREINQFCDYSQIKENEPNYQSWRKRHQQLIDLIYPAIAERARIKAEHIKQQFDSPHKLYDQDFAPGTMVMVKDPTRGSKYNPAYLGPFTVVRRSSTGPYILQDATGALFPRNVPVDHLKILQHTDAFEERVHEVEAILNHHKEERKTSYLVKWKDPDIPNTWQPEENFLTVEVKRDYWRRRGKASSQARNRA